MPNSCRSRPTRDRRVCPRRFSAQDFAPLQWLSLGPDRQCRWVRFAGPAEVACGAPQCSQRPRQREDNQGNLKTKAKHSIDELAPAREGGAVDLLGAELGQDVVPQPLDVARVPGVEVAVAGRAEVPEEGQGRRFRGGSGEEVQ